MAIAPQARTAVPKPRIRPDHRRLHSMSATATGISRTRTSAKVLGFS